MTKLNIAITGASGYIGTILVKKLKAENHQVLALSRKRVAAADHNISYSLGENIFLKGVDVLIHCAHDFTAKNYQINFDGSAKLFEQARRDEVKNIIFLSTTSAFEKTSSNYGRVKFEIENYVRSIDGTVIRAGLVFSKNSGGIVGALRNFVKKFPFAPLVGKGNQRFYPCHVDDLCALISYVASHPDKEKKSPIIAASEVTVTFKEIILSAAKSYKKRVVLIPIPYFILFTALRLAELLNINIGLRSDSLRYFKKANHKMDFWFTRKHEIRFRPYST